MFTVYTPLLALLSSMDQSSVCHLELLSINGATAPVLIATAGVAYPANAADCLTSLRRRAKSSCET